MPELKVFFPDQLDDAQRSALKKSLKASSARHLFDEKDRDKFPDGFDGDKHVDYLPFPYDPAEADVTAIVLVNITTWPKDNLEYRLGAIRDDVLGENPWIEEYLDIVSPTVNPEADDTMQDCISFSFVSKDAFVFG